MYLAYGAAEREFWLLLGFCLSGSNPGTTGVLDDLDGVVLKRLFYLPPSRNINHFRVLSKQILQIAKKKNNKERERE